MQFKAYLAFNLCTNACIYAFIYDIQVNTNGIISLNSPFTAYAPSSLPLSGTQQIIAPYWSQVDTRGTGKVFYQQTSDPGLLGKASNTIRAVFPLSQNVAITNLFIATWYAVGYYPRGTNKVNQYTA